VNAETTSASCEHAHEDGAYVLGALSPEDRLVFERHLPTCAACAQSVRELAGIPGLLARVPAEVVDSDRLLSPVPDTLLPGLVRRIRRTERRRRWVTAGMAGVAAAAAVVAIGFAALGGDDGPPGALPASPSASPQATASAEVMRPVGDEPISGWLALTQVGWGTRLDLTCSYATDSHDYDDPTWSTYTMYVHTANGSIERVASWRALPGKTMQLAAATAAERAEITSVEVRTSSGETVLELG
jgi:hypothetical protein